MHKQPAPWPGEPLSGHDDRRELALTLYLFVFIEITGKAVFLGRVRKILIPGLLRPSVRQ